MTWNDTMLLVVTSGVTSEFKNFGSEIFENRSKIYFLKSQRKVVKESESHTGCAGANTLGIVSLLQKTVDTTDRELETRFC
jgi:hypothetical protein